EYTANERGLILLPYSENPGVRFAVLQDGRFNSPERIQHLGEEYSFHAGIQLDPQSLNRRSTSQLILRPDLRIHGIPLDPSLLKDVSVTLASTDAQGTRSERQFTPEFENHQEWIRDFYVPDGLRKLEVTVEATIKRNIDLEEITLQDTFSLDVNQARTGNTLQQVLLVPSAEGWRLEVRGLNGEPISDEPLRVYLHHPGFKRPLDFQVTTDEQGSVEMGTLQALDRIRVSGTGLSLDLPLTVGHTVLPTRMHLLTGEPVSLPYPHNRSPDLQAASLFRKEHGRILDILNERVSIADGELRIEGLAAGTYRLLLHESGKTMDLEVVEGSEKSGYLLGEFQRLQRTDRQLPSVASVQRNRNRLMVQLRHPNRNTRVAVRAYRYAGPGGGLPPGYGFPDPSRRHLLPAYNQYVSGRNIGDEYRYVLERQSRTPFAGSLLDRPDLILNPWELRETSAEQEELKKDQAYRRGRQQLNEAASGGNGEERRHSGAKSSRYGYDTSEASPNDIGVDFLPTGSHWWLNRFPNENGRVELDLDGLNEHTALEIVVLDRFGSTVTRYLLPHRDFEPREVRLQNGLDPAQRFSRQKRVRKIDAQAPILFPDLATTRYQVIKDFGQAFDLLQTLSGNPELAAFQFLKTWPQLDEAAKRTHYGEFASHELHLFLYERDPDFFQAVVRPYLINKKDKTFMDRWLLDELQEEDTRLDSLQQRNALELALLARRGGDRPAMKAALREAWELLPPDPEGFAKRVRVALQAGELDEVSSLARDARREQAKNISRQLSIGGDSSSSSLSSSMEADAFGAPQPPMSKPEDSRSSLSVAQAERIAPAQELMVLDMEPEELDDIMPQADRLYRTLPKTKEWAEQNYYKLRVHQDVPERLTVNEFWRDVADGVELSPHLLQCHRNLTDVLAALAFSGLPFEADAPEETPEGAQLHLSVSSPAILVSEQILPADLSEDDRPLLLSQQFFRPDDRYRFEDNERIEKFISGEFIRRVVYGARVTLTNPTASRRRLNVLLQIPLGSIPVQNGFYTDDQSVLLEPYTTSTLEYFFTFPESGIFAQYPAHAAAQEAIIGQAEPRVFEVKDAPTEVDRSSWVWVSQHASPEDTLTFLQDHNLRRLNLDEMAWRLKDKTFYEQAVELLTNRAHFHDTTFSYGIHHKDPAIAGIWLANSSVARGVGPVFESPLLTVDPVERKTYEHLEYDPLVNPRTHEVGDSRIILNEALRNQYTSFLIHMMYRNELNVHDRLGLVYYLLLQDRLEEAVTELALLEPGQAHEQLQLQYLTAWLALRSLELDKALALAEPHAGHPVPRWRNRFQGVVTAVEEARGEEVAVEDDPSRQQDLNRLASGEPSIAVQLVSGEVRLTSHNLEEVTLNLYPM
ncbi:MAG: hypothetical protein PF795_15835, partial [Kiritimatiellae bacterium]|nr:hypothetical protein [Kiritimatiellia bacterium]